MKMKMKMLNPFRWVVNLLWRIQFKTVPFEGPSGYHCRDCVAGKRFFCGSFYCPLWEVPKGKFEWRFECGWYQKALEYAAHKLNS